MKKISVIVPVYNLEDCVLRCLESLRNQDLPPEEYELIFVDDGSTDDTAELLRRHLPENGRLISQKNNRQGAARNNGLRHAGGKYVWYVDGDDAAAPNVLGKLYAAMEANALDVLFFEYVEILPDGMRRPGPAIAGGCGRVYSGGEYLALRTLSLGPVYMYNREFLLRHSLFFMEGVSFEDSELMPRVCYHARRIMNWDEKPYLRYVREGSTTTVFKPDRVSDLAKVVSRMLDFAHAVRGDAQSGDIAYYAAMVFNTFFSRYRRLTRREKQGVLLPAGLSRTRVVQAMQDSRFPKYRLEGLALRLLWPFFFPCADKSAGSL